MPLLIEHLVKDYPAGVRALEDVSLEVRDGEFLGIIGLSGSGKSTLLRCINRLVEPTSGDVWLDDVNITKASRKDLRGIRRRIGMIFQQFNLVKRSSVITNVLSGRLGYTPTWYSFVNYFPTAERQRALDALKRVGIAEKAN